jgi:hypothetical protein
VGYLRSHNVIRDSLCFIGPGNTHDADGARWLHSGTNVLPVGFSAKIELEKKFRRDAKPLAQTLDLHFIQIAPPVEHFRHDAGRSEYFG